MKQLNLQSVNIKSELVQFQYQRNLPVKIVQFGEGNFLRGFVDWMVHEMNKQGLFNGKIVAIQPTPHGKVVPKLDVQDGLYTLVQQGIDEGEIVEHFEVISSIDKWVNPYESWNEVLQYAESEDIEFVFSNTTEAGLTYYYEPFTPEQSVLSFPGKLTAFLYHRFQAFNGDKNKGVTVIPCELIENNGEVLKRLVLKISDDWALPNDFKQWISNDNNFCNTLVDRIIPGYPKDTINAFQEKIGYRDELLVVGEPYHLFAIEATEEIAEKLPFHKAGLNVRWGDITPYRNLKVNILNAPHTMMFSIGYLSGLNTVYETMKDETLYNFIYQSIHHEILPTIDFDEKTLQKFTSSILDRFKNPFVKHYLSDLGLNAVSKFKARVLPILMKSIKENNRIPQNIAFSFAALIVYYQSTKIVDAEHLLCRRSDGEEYKVRDSKEAIATFYMAWSKYDGTSQSIHEMISCILENELLWDENLNDVERLTETIANYTEKIIANGVGKAMGELFRGNRHVNSINF
ncbi:tagaturonate reductase [Peribacillus sp. NPDC097225]|uniref:tagaturonate reductase n=1 Tax=Peribacillus sp. NPDC097225 TaxID=3364400 RepID=UPI003804C995